MNDEETFIRAVPMYLCGHPECQEKKTERRLAQLEQHVARVHYKKEVGSSTDHFTSKCTCDPHKYIFINDDVFEDHRNRHDGGERSHEYVAHRMKLADNMPTAAYEAAKRMAVAKFKDFFEPFTIPGTTRLERRPLAEKCGPESIIVAKLLRKGAKIAPYVPPGATNNNNGQGRSGSPISDSVEVVDEVPPTTNPSFLQALNAIPYQGINGPRNTYWDNDPIAAASSSGAPHSSARSSTDNARGVSRTSSVNSVQSPTTFWPAGAQPAQMNAPSRFPTTTQSQSAHPATAATTSPSLPKAQLHSTHPAPPAKATPPAPVTKTAPAPQQPAKPAPFASTSTHFAAGMFAKKPAAQVPAAQNYTGPQYGMSAQMQGGQPHYGQQDLLTEPPGLRRSTRQRSPVAFGRNRGISMAEGYEPTVPPRARSRSPAIDNYQLRDRSRTPNNGSSSRLEQERERSQQKSPAPVPQGADPSLPFGFNSSVPPPPIPAANQPGPSATPPADDDVGLLGADGKPLRLNSMRRGPPLKRGAGYYQHRPGGTILQAMECRIDETRKAADSVLAAANYRAQQKARSRSPMEQPRERVRRSPMGQAARRERSRSPADRPPHREGDSPERDDRRSRTPVGRYRGRTPDVTDTGSPVPPSPTNSRAHSRSRSPAPGPSTRFQGQRPPKRNRWDE